MKSINKKTKTLIITLSIVLSGIFSWSFVDNYFEISKNLDIFATLYRELNTYYVDEIPAGDLMKKAIDSMLESLDPYTVFIPESDIEDYRYMTTGQYGGIGSMIQQRGDYVVISDPYEGFPAQLADLRAGDMILEVNGNSVKGKNTEELSKLLKGQPNTTVKMLIEREGEEKPLEKTLTRAEIKVNNVPYYGMIDDEIGIIKLTGFTNNAAKEVSDALIALKEKHHAKSIVIDLRGNPGGLLREAVDIVNIFVPKGQEVVSTRGKVKDWDRSHKAINSPIDLGIPIAVLVDRGSASASEIVSGAIQDLDRGVVIGQKTYGKGLVQQTRPLSYNAQLKVTVAKYYIPSGRCIQSLDYSHRGEGGSVEKVPDSLITAFKTNNNRIVCDGGGVMPDIKTEPQKFSNITHSLVNKSLIFDYATKYRIKHESINPAKEFQLTDTDYEDFKNFLADKEYDYSTSSEEDLEDLIASAKTEKYYEDLEKEFEMLKGKIIHNKSGDLDSFKEELKMLLESEIASRYYFQTGRLEAALKYDPELKEAVAILSDQKKYQEILTKIEETDRPLNANRKVK